MASLRSALLSTALSCSCLLACGGAEISPALPTEQRTEPATSAVGSTVICTWKGDRRAAFSPTYDDMPGKGWFSLAQGLAPLHQRLGIRGSVAIVPNARWLHGRGFPPGVGWSDLKAVLDQGWIEPMSHTYTHPSLPQRRAGSMDAQFLDANKAIKENTGYSVLSLAYPYGHYNGKAIDEAKKYYVSARAFDHLLNLEPGKENPYAIHSVELVSKTTDAEVDGWFAETLQHGGWMVTTTHALKQYKDGWQPVEDEVVVHELEEGKRLVGEGSVWNEGFTTVSKYVRERNELTPAVSVPSANEIDVSFPGASAASASWMDVPLTVRTVVPADWRGVQVSHGREAQVVQASARSGRNEVLFDALPGESTRLTRVQ